MPPDFDFDSLPDAPAAAPRKRGQPDPAWLDYIDKKDGENGVSASLVKGLIQTESDWDPAAKNPNSSATGLGQFINSTADEVGITDRTDPYQNIDGIYKYLGQKLSQHAGDEDAALRAYGEPTDEYVNKVQTRAAAWQGSPGDSDTDAGSAVRAGFDFDSLPDAPDTNPSRAASIASLTPTTPDDAGAALNASRANQLSPTFNAQNPDVVRAAAQKQKIDDTLPTTPILAAHMASDVTRAAAAKDDIDPLSTLEWFLHGKWEDVPAPVGGVFPEDGETYDVRGGENGPVYMREVIPPAWQLFLAKGVFALRSQELGIKGGTIGNNSDDKEQLKLSQEASAESVPNTDTLARKALGASVEALPQVVTMMGSSARAAIWLSSFGQMHNQLSQEVNEDGTQKFSETESRLLSVAAATAFDQLFGPLGSRFAGRLVPQMFKAQAQSVAASALVKSFVDNPGLVRSALIRAGSAAKNWMAGAVFVAGQGVVNDLFDQLGGGHLDVGRLWKTAREGARSGLMLGPLSAAGPALDYIGDVGRWAGAEKGARDLGTIVAAANDSKYAKRSPEDFKELVDETVGPDQGTVHVAPEALEKVYGEDAQAVVHSVTGDEAALSDAKLLGSPVEVATSDYLTSLREHADELAPDAKLDGKGFTPREAAEFDAAHDDSATKSQSPFADWMQRLAVPEGGFSYNIHTGEEPTKGFMVSTHEDLSRAFDHDKITSQDLLDFLVDRADALNEPNTHFGGWHDSDTGRVFLDVSSIVKTEEEATQLARDHDQKRYRDMEKGVNVLVNPGATSGGAAADRSGNGDQESAGQAPLPGGGDEPGAAGGDGSQDAQKPDEKGNKPGGNGGNGGSGEGPTGGGAPPGGQGGPAPAGGGSGGAAAKSLLAERATLEQHVRAEVAADPAGHALSILHDGPHKIDRAFAKREMGEAIADRLEKLGVLGKSTEHPNDLANRLGFADAHSLAHALLGVPDEAAIATEAHRRLVEAHPEAIGRALAETQRQAIEDAHSPQEMERVLREIGALREQLGKDAKHAPAKALAEAGRKTARPDLFPPEHYAGLEAEAEKRAREANAAGDAAAEKAARDTKDVMTAARKEAERFQQDQKDLAYEEAAADAKAHKRLLAGAIETPGELEMSEVQAKAEAYVAKQPLVDLDPSTHLTLERAQARKAALAVLKGDIQGAIDAKQRQLANMFAWRAARDAAADGESIKSAIARASTDKAAELFAKAGGQVDPAYQEGYDALTRAIGSRPDNGAIASPSIQRQIFANTLQHIAADHGAESVSEQLANMDAVVAAPKPLEQMTLVQAREVRDALKNLRTAAKNATEVVIAEKTADVKDVIRQMREFMANRPKRELPAPSDAGKTDLDVAGSRVENILAEMTNPEVILREFGPAGQALFDKFTEARNLGEKLQNEVGEKLQAAIDAMPSEIGRARFDGVDGPGSPRLNDNKWVRQDLWNLFAWMGNESNASRAIGGLDVPEVQIHQALDQLTKQEKDFIQSAVWDLNDKELRPLLAEQARRKTGLEPTWIKAKPITTKDGTYRGGYIHASYNREASSRAGKLPENVEDYYGNLKAGFPAAPKGFMKERVEGFSDVPNLNWSAHGSHVQQVLHVLAVDDFVSTLGRFLRDQEFRHLALDTVGKPKLDQLDQFLAVAARGKVEAPAEGARTFNTIVGSAFRSRAATTAFALNPRVVLGQLSHLPAAAAGLGISPQHMLAGISKALDASTWAEAHANSKQLPYRWNSFSEKTREMMQNLGPGDVERPGMLTRALTTPLPRGAAAVVQRGANTLGRWTDAAGFSMYHLMDGFLSMAIWRAREAQALAVPGTTPEEAHAAADRAISDIMPKMNLAEGSSLVRDRGMIGSLMLVKKFPNTLYNAGALKMFKAKTGVWEAQAQQPGNPWAKAAAYAGGAAGLAGGYLGMTLSAHILGRYIMGHGRHEDEKTGQYFARQALTAPFYPIPFGEEISTPLIEKIIDHKEINRDSVERSFHAAPAVAFLENEMEALGTAMDGHKRPVDRSFAALDAFMAARGAPTQPLQTAKYVYDRSTGRIRPRGPVDEAAGLLYGKRPHQDSNPLSDLSKAIGE